MSAPLARVDDLRIRFHDQLVVDGVSFEIAEGECLALVGESGSGKTLSARSLLGLVPRPGIVEAAAIELDGRDARRFRADEWRQVRGRDIGLVSQDALISLDPLRTIGSEVGEAAFVHGIRGRRVRGAELQDAVIAELRRVAIPDPESRIRQRPHELSGGQRQRALIASATIAGPRLLIADEPTTALDVSVQAQVLDVLEELKQQGHGLLIISHDLAVVARIADRIAVMRDGRIIEEGSTAAVLRDPREDYTRALLAANPATRARGERLSSVPPLVLTARSAPTADAAERPVLEARGVSQSFRRPDGTRIRAVDDVSFELLPGQTIGVVGESGSGKTTLGRILLGLQQPDAGEVLLLGEPWSTLPERKRRDRRATIQAIYQDPMSSFDPRSTVRHILDEALAIDGVPSSERRARSLELADRVGLDPALLGRRPLSLSGGQRQRVAIARALVRSPQVLICDEPVTALDVSVQAQVLDALADIQSQLGLAMVFISHDLGVIRHVSHEILVMRDGVVVERGDSETVFTQPEHPYTRELLAALPPAPGAGFDHRPERKPHDHERPRHSPTATRVSRRPVPRN